MTFNVDTQPFYRELTAFCTGVCGFPDFDDTGFDFVFPEEITVDFSGIAHVPDEQGCERPSLCIDSESIIDRTILISTDDPRAERRCMLLWFDSAPTDEQTQFIEDRIPSFFKYVESHHRFIEFYVGEEIKIESITTVELEPSVIT